LYKIDLHLHIDEQGRLFHFEYEEDKVKVTLVFLSMLLMLFFLLLENCSCSCSFWERVSGQELLSGSKYGLIVVLLRVSLLVLVIFVYGSSIFNYASQGHQYFQFSCSSKLMIKDSFHVI